MSTIDIGSVIRDYEIVKRIGRGGMGQVFLVRHRLLGFQRAMKLLRPGLPGTSDAPERFLREASLLSSLHHPNIVSFYEFGALEDGTQFLVMEHLKGAVLYRRIAARGRLEVAEALTSFIGICNGLEEAHKHGIVHRDVSSDNVFFAITPSGEVAKLIDFGIALPTDGATFSRLTQSGMFLGKCAYASPEQLGVSGQAAPFDARADLYALGVVLYEALSGGNPFADSTLEGIMRRKAAGKPPRFSESSPERGIPTELDDLIQSMLDIDAGQRPQSAGAIREELERIERSLGDKPVPEPPRKTLKGAQLEVNTQVGEYSIEAVLGQGGMGTVYQARHRLLGVARALKVVSPRWVRDVAQRERFLREARLLAQLEHPNLVKVYDISPLAEGSYYMVQELVSGESLRDRLKRAGRLTPRQSVPLFVAAAHGLHACHKGGVVHRDISPDNIMVIEDGRGGETVKIIDFGIAKSTLTAEDAEITSTRTFIGKLEYCSPEQAGKLEPHEDIDGRADVYSLGVVMYQALVGKLPFFADTPQGYLAKHLTALPPTPKSVGVELPERLEALLLRMLEKERDQRPGSALELAQLLDQSLGSAAEREPSSEQSTVVLNRPKTDRQGSPSLGPTTSRSATAVRAGVAAAALSLAVLGVVYTLRSDRRASLAASLASPSVATPIPPASTPAVPRTPAPTVTPPPPAERARQLVAEGHQLFVNEQLVLPAGASAFDRFRQALGVDPGNVEAIQGLERIRDHYLQQGDGFRARGKIEQAREQYQHAQGVIADNVVAARFDSLVVAAVPTATPAPRTVQPTATPPPATPAPVATAVHVDPVAAMWTELQRTPSISSVEAFLAAHPGLPANLRNEAIELVGKLRDEQAFSAIDRSSRKSIDTYLQTFLQGRHRDAASGLLGQLDQDARDALAVAERENTPASYARFLSMHADAPVDLLQQAAAKQRQIAGSDDEAFREARRLGSIAAFLDYIQKHPRGTHIHEALELFGAPKQGILALKLVRGVAAREKSVKLAKDVDERQAMDYLGQLGIVPCDGVWDEEARLTPDDFRCIAAVDPRTRSEPYVIDLPQFAALVAKRLRDHGR